MLECFQQIYDRQLHVASAMLIPPDETLVAMVLNCGTAIFVVLSTAVAKNAKRWGVADGLARIKPTLSDGKDSFFSSCSRDENFP